MLNIEDLEKNVLIDISQAKSFQELQIIKVRELGKKGKNFITNEILIYCK